MIALDFLVCTAFCRLKLLRISKDVFFSGFLVWLRADILKYFKRDRDEKSKKDAF